ncbi:SAM-dependent methyltransferase [Haloechinothrix halophila]|uniref:SAM-dependent methyltransferase n=1 Tax=Haloechinothrix halophila TaxID=1069073 RepID=UPI0003FA9EC6|nr:methyltransferase domain-containing protein [Haloechinothrix halophila]
MTAITETDPREAFAERLLEDVTRSMETLSVYLGVKLGLYHALAATDGATERDLADRAGIATRYASEWLSQQAAAGYIDCDNPGVEPEQRRYRLAEHNAEVLTDPDSPFHVAPLTRMFAGCTSVLPQLLEAYRTGGGVPYEAYGIDIREGIAGVNRPMFVNELADWIAAAPTVEQRLRSAPTAKVLDLGCGIGHSSIALAKAFPRASVVGVDLDEASVAQAREIAAEAGVADRVTFVVGDAAQVQAEDTYDLVMMFETLHDMGDPVGALRAARSVLAEDGAVLIGDERVGDQLTAPADLMERFQFGWSVLHCVAATIAEDPVEVSGTVLRTPTVLRWARQAGYTDSEVLDIDNDFWRFYLLRK